MTRIIAGEFGGRRIAVPPRGTRPTSDRVREALFSRLDHEGDLVDAHVVDVFAGSGALGIEALSRGASESTFVESAASAARVIQSNLRALSLNSRAHVVKERAHPYLTRATHTWDVAFLDPPYDISHMDLAAVLTALEPRLREGAPVVLEWATKSGDAPWPPGIKAVRSKRYGDTTVHWGERAVLR